MRSVVIAFLAALSIASTAIAQPILRGPHRNTWRGTITTTEGLTGRFVARTHLKQGGDDLDTEFVGQFRCRGSACLFRHGQVSFEVANDVLSSRSPRLDAVTFGFGGVHPDVYCVYESDEPPPNLLIVGAYSCYSAAPPGPPPGQALPSGTLNLVPAHLERFRHY